MQRIGIFVMFNMMRKKFITLFCLLVLSVQMLPVRQIGALLSSNQLTEELPHSDDAKSSVLKYEPTIHDPMLGAGLLQTHLLATIAFRFSRFASALPSVHAGDIHTPPPNMA